MLCRKFRSASGVLALRPDTVSHEGNTVYVMVWNYIADGGDVSLPTTKTTLGDALGGRRKVVGHPH